MKKIIAVLLMGLIMISSVSVFAESWEQEITVTYNGEQVEFNVEPRIINDRTMVPFRAIFETLGGTVDFDATTRTVSSVKDGQKLSFVIGESEAYLEKGDEKEIISIDSPPVIVDDYTLVPVRFVAEGSGLKVNWDADFREVVIIDTEVWRNTIKEKSPFLDKLLNTTLNLKNMKAIEETESASLKISFAVDNAEEITGGVDKIGADITLNFKSDTYFDGECAEVKSAITMDISSIDKLIKQINTELTAEDSEMISEIFKNHNFNIDIVTDKDKNVYLKSEEIVDLIGRFGSEGYAQMIGDNYIKIPVNADVNALPETGTIWSYIEALVVGNDNLTTEDVISIGYIVDASCDIYSADCVKLEEKANGGYKATFNVTKNDFIKAMKNMTDKIWAYEEAGLSESEKQFAEEQKQQMLAEFEKVDVQITGFMEITDLTKQTADVKASVKITDLLIPETDNARISLGIEIELKDSVKPSTSGKKVEVPKNVVDIMQ